MHFVLKHAKKRSNRLNVQPFDFQLLAADSPVTKTVQVVAAKKLCGASEKEGTLVTQEPVERFGTKRLS
jgi:hypothetical protein